MSGTWTRRDFIVRAGVTGGLLAAGAAACSDDDDASEGADGGGDDVGDDGGTGSDGLDGDAFPSEATIHGWIAEVVDQGIRRPGYEADDWAIDWVADRFRDIGLDDVHTEPVDVLRWEPVEWSLEVTAADGTTESLDCFPVPYAAPTPEAGLDLELAAYDRAAPAAVAGKASLYDVTLLRLPGNFMATAGSIPAGATAESRSVDPEGTLADPQVIPFGGEIMQVLEPSIEAGAAAFIGVLSDYPGDSYEYYVPYDAEERPLPGVWVRGSDGARLRDLLAAGPVRVRLAVATDVRTVESANVVGDLPGLRRRGRDDRLAPRRPVGLGGRGRQRHRPRPRPGDLLGGPTGRGAAAPAAVPAAGRAHVRRCRADAVHRSTTAPSCRRSCSRSTSSTRRSSSRPPTATRPPRSSPPGSPRPAGGSRAGTPTSRRRCSTPSRPSGSTGR